MAVKPRYLYVTLLYSSFAIAHADEGFEQLLAMDIRDLTQISVRSASGIDESVRDAPASMVVITADDIRRRGYDDLIQVLNDLPGFDVSLASGDYYVSAYQRGYRTPFSQRTLLLVDGVVANDLWSQVADFSHQYPLQAIERIEVLYGPGSALHGANAFAGVVQIITHGAKKASAEAHGGLQLRSGSYDTHTFDANYAQAFGDLKLRLDVRYYESSEPGLDDLHGFKGFLEPKWLANPAVWGPILDHRNNGYALGSYHSPAEMSSILLNAEYENWKSGVFWSHTRQGYGTKYAGDHSQPNVPWGIDSAHVYLQRADNPSDGATLTTRLSARGSWWKLDYAEASPDTAAGMENYSFVSYSHWSVDNHAWQFEQQLELPVWKNWQWLLGWKFEHQTLTRSYAVCGYYEPQSYCPQLAGIEDPGPAGLGPWVVHSSADALPYAPHPDDIGPANMTDASNRGAHVQGIYSWQDFRFNIGLRYDNHGFYGSTTSPRTAIIYQPSPQITFKLLHGRAWQEPPSIQVYGGWNGRAANERMQPEKVSNTEFVIIHQQQQLLQELSLFHAIYDDVIRISADNGEGRTIDGVEYRSRYVFSRNLAREIEGYFYYTYTDARDDQRYDFAAESWIEGEAAVGDIARHKLQLGVNIPIGTGMHVNLRARYIGKRALYGTNPLRAQGIELDDYAVADLYAEYRYHNYYAGLGIDNIFDAHYQHPGIGAADAGVDDSRRALGWFSSVLPQPGRSAYLSLGLRYQ
jgi:iron complex outermembrane receptor protein